MKTPQCAFGGGILCIFAPPLKPTDKKREKVNSCDIICLFLFFNLFPYPFQILLKIVTDSVGQ
jgi:hypothetical protein